MSYDKNKDILRMYKWKCGFTKNDDDFPCPVKFLDKKSLILHLQFIHGYVAKDLRIPDEDKKVLKSIELTYKGVNKIWT